MTDLTLPTLLPVALIVLGVAVYIIVTFLRDRGWRK